MLFILALFAASLIRFQKHSPIGMPVCGFNKWSEEKENPLA